VFNPLIALITSKQRRSANPCAIPRLVSRPGGSKPDVIAQMKLAVAEREKAAEESPSAFAVLR
jgi:hypothetical protein